LHICNHRWWETWHQLSAKIKVKNISSIPLLPSNNSPNSIQNFERICENLILTDHLPL
jgi:hypothetical protein